MNEPNEPLPRGTLGNFLKKLWRWNKSNTVLDIEGMLKDRKPSGTHFKFKEGGPLGGSGKGVRPRWQ
jgi:hypothetical protein